MVKRGFRKSKINSRNKSQDLLMTFNKLMIIVVLALGIIVVGIFAFSNSNINDDVSMSPRGGKILTSGGTAKTGTIVSGVRGAPSMPIAEPKPAVNKNRYISFIPNNTGSTALRVKLTSLHHPAPPTSGSKDFSAFEGQYRWVGPPGVYREAEGDSRTFKAAQLQCEPYYTDWGSVGLIHVTGAEIVPSSIYEVQMINQGCNVGDSSCYSPSLIVNTSRWGDVELPFNPPTSEQPNVIDIASVVNKLKGLVGAPPKVQTKLQPNIPNSSADIK